MLTKLLKYEFRSIGRQLIPLYLGVLGLAVVNHFFWFSVPANRGGLNEFLGGIPAYAAMMGYCAVCVALFVVTALLIIQRFYKGLLTEEGYLMFTLPCKTWQLIAAKGITAAVMIAVGTCVGILSAMLMAANAQTWGALFRGIGEIPWGELFRAHALWPLYVVETIILIIVGLFSSIGHVYVSIALGHLSNKHRVALAIVAYIVINVVWSSIFGAITRLIDIFRWDQVMCIWVDNLNTPGQIHLMMLILIAVCLIPAAVYFIGTNWILSKKLNLE